MLDHVPLATLYSIAAVVIAVIAYLNHDLSVFQALAAVGITHFGAGKLGEARNGAGRGLRGTTR